MCYVFYVKALIISDSDTMLLALQGEIRRSQEARYDHRLHAILLVAQGMTCPDVATLLGDSPRSVQYWVNRFEQEGFSGLADADRPGCPRKLEDHHLDIINKALRKLPRDAGIPTNIWDGKSLSAFIKQQFDIDFGVRQSQRLFRQLGFRLRKPQSIIAKANVEQQAAYKKSSEIS
jgi:transposase